MHKSGTSPYKMFKMKNSLASPVIPSQEINSTNNSRQSFETTYDPNGYVDIVRTNNLSKFKSLHGPRMRIWQTDRVPDIDNEFDIKFANSMIREKNSKCLSKTYLIMETYLSVNYSKLEDGKDDYPQKLCDYLIKAFFMKHCDVENKKILDVGSGRGNHLISFARAGMQPVGLDKRSECIKARKDIKIVSCDIENQPFPFEDNTFDFVFSKSVCEHINNTEGFFRESSRVLRQGGLGLFMTPDWASQSDHFLG